MVSPTASLADARRRAVRLSTRTSLRVGGAPDYLFEPATRDEALGIVRLCLRHGVPLRFLGGGSNLLVGEGRLAGAVVATRRMTALRIEEHRVIAGAGVAFPRLVRLAIRRGIPGLAGCPGIPGSVGGAVAMNAGGRHGCVADALVEVRGIDAEGRPYHRPVEEGDLGYRRSVFASGLVTEAVFRRDPALDPAEQRTLYRDALRSKQASQPLAARSAGCIFRNPGRASAGRLIETAGLKGARVGGACVSTRHANFIVNDGGATAEDVAALIGIVRETVRERHGVELELEVRVWS